MTTRYTIDGGRRPAPAHERLVVDDDGSFTMWRSMSTLSSPPSPVGRFGGSLSSEARAGLEAAARAAAESGDLAESPPPDAAIQVVHLDGAAASAGVNSRPGGPWGALFDLLRAELGELAGQPVAAVALEVDAGADQARLRHLGSEPLALDLGGADVRVVIWRDEVKAGDWRSGDLGTGRHTAKPGWTLDLPFDHGLEHRAGDKLDVYVSMRADDGGAVPLLLFHRVE